MQLVFKFLVKVTINVTLINKVFILRGSLWSSESLFTLIVINNERQFILTHMQLIKINY